jgi:hypothetical protein
MVDPDYDHEGKRWIGVRDFQAISDNGNYIVAVDFEGFDDERDVVDFFNEYVKTGMEIERPVYGSSDAAREEVAASDAVAMHGDEQLPDEWAVDAGRLLQKYVGPEPEDPFSESVEEISAMTLSSVSLAEGGSGGRQRYEFYRELVAEPEDEEGPIVIPVGETEEEELTSVVEPVNETVEDEVEQPAEPVEEDVYGSELGLSEDLLEEEGSREAIHEAILSDTVEDAKERIEMLDEPDYSGLKETEEEGKDRVTLKRYLDDQMEEQEEK